ncbi:MAG: gamma-glutamyltransferase [Ectothiorhodospiraceae bacterium]|nr:gamma-glutamyltransferase [Chromatiales bacterium]MCP5156270.1 gamma-glutamyltransferase [Ectothiorhodospiraceae bacterium]
MIGLPTFAVARRLLASALIGASLALPALSVVVPSAAEARDTQSLGVPGVRGGVVATSEPEAARVGAEILRRGGNAVDAAAAIAFALNVVEPQSAGIGGGGFMMIHHARSGRTFVIDSRERAPAAADPEMFLGASGSALPFGLRSTSGIGVGVPGMVRGLALALDEVGTMGLADVIEPAVALAENGFRVSSRLAESIAAGVAPGGRLANEPGDPAYDEARAVFAPGGVPLARDALLVQPALAATLRRIADEGQSAFYAGDIAQAIVDTQRNARTTNGASSVDPADVERMRGRMTLDDLAGYTASVRDPVVGKYRGYRVVSMPPPSSGGLTVIQILKLMEHFPIGDAAAGYGLGGQRTLNVMLESMRLAFADRAVWMGDTDFVSLPVRGLVDDDYLATRAALIDPDARQASVVAGDPRPYDSGAGGGHLAQLSRADTEGLNTTHFSVVDRHGNVVTYTNTIESAWGTGLMVPGYGFLLNNELTDFNSTPTANPDPDAFDPGANDVAPFKRPRSSMAPTMLFDGRRPLVALGSPGGSTIINSVVNVTSNLIDHGRNVQEAVDAPRISQTSANGSPNLEAGFDLDVIDALRGLGHNLADSRLTEIGSVQSVVIDQRGGLAYGAGDRRRIGAVQSIRLEEIDSPRGHGHGHGGHGHRRHR